VLQGCFVISVHEAMRSVNGACAVAGIAASVANISIQIGTRMRGHAVEKSKRGDFMGLGLGLPRAARR